jgi:hypothetical protein
MMPSAIIYQEEPFLPTGRQVRFMRDAKYGRKKLWDEEYLMILDAREQNVQKH